MVKTSEQKRSEAEHRREVKQKRIETMRKLNEQKRIETLRFCIKAITDRFYKIANDQDPAPFNPDILKRYGITLNQFSKTVNNIDDVIEEMDGKINENTRKKLIDEYTTMVLLEVADNEEVRSKVVRMDEKTIKDLYDKKLYNGVLCDEENIAFFVYRALTKNNRKLASKNRKKVIQGLHELPDNMGDYFSEIRLGGIMKTYSKKESENPILAILKIFDKEYQKRRYDESLFDQTEKHHYNPELKPRKLVGV